jgi:hypothetical protein
VILKSGIKKHTQKNFPENIGKRLSIDETSLSNGELYTILTNKTAKGKKGIVAMVAGTKQKIITIEKSLTNNGIKLPKSPLIWQEIWDSLLGNVFQMQLVLSTDSTFKLASEALQEIRIKYRWQTIDQENEAIEKPRKKKKV